ncbi:MAG TPA: hypothetical protein VNI84_05380 [Pyrinomonadaceae bacterium]|nr:hypothetical protein [Pyrinomonadaceae bacterium]
MKKNSSTAVFMSLMLPLAFMLSAVNLHAQRNKVTNPGVRAQFLACDDSTIGCENQAVNRVRMDGNTQYIDGQEGVSAVFNVGSGSMDLTINLITSQRSVILDFSDVHKFYNNAGNWVVPSWYSAPQQVKPHFNVLKAYNAKLNCGDAVAGCALRTAMNAGGWKVGGDKAEYALQWNPESTFKAVVNEQGPTSYVNVFYQNKGDGTGDVFTITPIPNSDSNKVVSDLAKTLNRTTSNAGQYVMPFKLIVTPK